MFGINGMGIFPSYKVGIYSYLAYLDTNCLGQQKKKNFAPAHYVLHPDMWEKVRVNSTFTFQREEPVAEFAINLHSPDPDNSAQDSWKTNVTVLKHHADFNFKPGNIFKCFKEDIELLKMYSFFKIPRTIFKKVRNEFDISPVLGMNSDKDGDLFKLN